MPRSRYIIILAGSKAEGYRYARRSGIPARQCRIPLYAKQIVGLRVADIHVLPSFKEAPHRHSLLAALRQVRGHGVDLKFIDVEMPEPLEAPPVDQGDGFGEQLTIDQLVDQARDFEREVIGAVYDTLEEHEVPPVADECLLAHGRKSLQDGHAALQTLADDEEEPDGEEAGETESGEDPPQDEVDFPDQPRRRRSRCGDCGELMDFEGHDCPAAVKTPRERLASPPGEFF